MIVDSGRPRSFAISETVHLSPSRSSILHLSASFMCFAMMAFLSLECVLPRPDTGPDGRTLARSLPKGVAFNSAKSRIAKVNASPSPGREREGNHPLVVFPLKTEPSPTPNARTFCVYLYNPRTSLKSALNAIRSGE